MAWLLLVVTNYAPTHFQKNYFLLPGLLAFGSVLLMSWDNLSFELLPVKIVRQEKAVEAYLTDRESRKIDRPNLFLNREQKKLLVETFTLREYS